MAQKDPEERREYKRRQRQRPEYKEMQRKANRKYNQKPEVQERQRQRRQTTEYKEMHRECNRKYRQRPEVKEKIREYNRQYNQRPEVKERNKERKRKPEYLEQLRQRYHRMGGQGYRRHFAALIERDGPVCGICKNSFELTDDIHIDHIRPVSKGGTSDFSNLQLAHAFCNVSKYNRWDGDKVAQSAQMCLFDAVKE